MRGSRRNAWKMDIYVFRVPVVKFRLARLGLACIRMNHILRNEDASRPDGERKLQQASLHNDHDFMTMSSVIG